MKYGILKYKKKYSKHLINISSIVFCEELSNIQHNIQSINML